MGSWLTPVLANTNIITEFEKAIVNDLIRLEIWNYNILSPICRSSFDYA